MEHDSKHTERAFEDAIEHHLVSVAGWRTVAPSSFDRERALFPAEFFVMSGATSLGRERWERSSRPRAWFFCV